MANLIDLLKGQLSDGLVESLASQIGGADKQKTATAASGVISMITSALAKNAATPQGQSALLSALDRDHDGSILDDLMGYATGSMQKKQNQSASMFNGAGILKHILGGKQAGAIDVISQMSGLAKGQSGNLMAMLAPMVMGMLGKQKRQNNLDGGGLFDVLNNSVKSTATKQKDMGMFAKFLDQDGDGKVVDDVAGWGMKLLGRFFKRR